MLEVLIVATGYPFPEHRDGLAKINANLLTDNPWFRAELLCIDDEPASPPTSRIHTLTTRSGGGALARLIAMLTSRDPMAVKRFASYLGDYREFLLRHHERYDVIHVGSPYLAPLVDLLPAEIVAKMLWFPIDCMSLFWSRRAASASSVLRRLLYRVEWRKSRAYERRYYRQFKQAIFVSDVDREEARALAPTANVASIPNGVDIDYFAPSSAPRSPGHRLVFTGDMAYAPNRDAAVFLIEQVLPRIPARFKAHLYLVGQRPDAALLALAGPQVTVTGFVDDLRPYLADASVYVAPLRFGSGIKNKVLEAMAMGCLVVGSKICFEGIECHPLHDCLEVAADGAAIADMLGQVFDAPDRFAPIGSRARQLVQEKYSWNSVRKAYGELYENSINQ